MCMPNMKVVLFLFDFFLCFFLFLVVVFVIVVVVREIIHSPPFHYVEICSGLVFCSLEDFINEMK